MMEINKQFFKDEFRFFFAEHRLDHHLPESFLVVILSLTLCVEEEQEEKE